MEKFFDSWFVLIIALLVLLSFKIESFFVGLKKRVIKMFFRKK